MASVVATFTLSRARTSALCLTAVDSQPQDPTPILAYFSQLPYARGAASLFSGSNKHGPLLLTIHLARSEVA